MVVDLELVPKQKRPPGERCCEPVAYPDVERDEAIRMAEVAKALGDPIRLQLVDVLRKHAGKVCVSAGTAAVREIVLEKYSAAARAAADGTGAGCCSPADGAGADVLISARRVGATGKAIGLDMTDEMLELARRNAAEAGLENAEFLQGYIEDMPLGADTVDVVISNCVINLSTDKPAAVREAARVLRPGWRFAVSDVIADEDMDEATRADMAAWTGCIAGALTEAEFRGAPEAAGFVDVEIQVTHRVHEHAAAAIIRARKPAR